MEYIYDSLSTDTMVIEVLQNGTLRWLGQNLTSAAQAKPIPPIPVKALHVSTTLNETTLDEYTQGVPFQVEDWASEYTVPLGLSGNNSIFSNTNMLVFLVNDNVSKVTVWWDGNDTAIQTPYAWRNVYFNDDVTSSTLSYGLLNNSRIELNIPKTGNLIVNSRVVGDSATYKTDFLRVNDDSPDCGSGPSFVIYNGVVRDIVQHEPEYQNGVNGCPNFYAQVFLTFPANATYYTYSVRTIFVNSNQNRNVTDLSAIQLSNLSGNPLTEDGTSGGYPVSSISTGYFYDGSPTGWDHHWSQVSSGTSGAGIMFTNSTNENLYVFDGVQKSGALNVQSSRIEVNPVDSSLNSVSFLTSKDLTWYGAVVTFSNEPIYPTSGHNGLWVMVEHPPIVTVN